jgi:hypothetical protein
MHSMTSTSTTISADFGKQKYISERVYGMKALLLTILNY